MKDEHLWHETKFVRRHGKLKGTRDRKFLSSISLVIADIVAPEYDRAFQIYARGDLLDLGCGHVPFYGAYRSYVKSVTCVDWENTLHKNAYLDIVCDMNKPLPIADGSFDTIILSDVLEHIIDPEQLIKEAFRLLRGGGVLLINTPFLWWIHEAPYDYLRYTRYAYALMARNAGFHLEYIKDLGGLIESTSYLIMHCFSLLNALKLYPFRAVSFCLIACTRMLCQGFSKTSLGKYIQQKTPEFTLGYFAILIKKEL